MPKTEPNFIKKIIMSMSDMNIISVKNDKNTVTKINKSVLSNFINKN